MPDAFLACDRAPQLTGPGKLADGVGRMVPPGGPCRLLHVLDLPETDRFARTCRSTSQRGPLYVASVPGRCGPNTVLTTAAVGIKIHVVAPVFCHHSPLRWVPYTRRSGEVSVRLLATGYGMAHEVSATTSRNHRGLRTPAPGRWCWPPELARSWAARNAGGGARGCRTVLCARDAEELDRQSQETTGKAPTTKGCTTRRERPDQG